MWETPAIASQFQPPGGTPGNRVGGGDEALPQKIDWEQQEFVEVRPGVFGATVNTPQLTATLYRYRRGSSWEEHRHPEDQITMVLEGVIDFQVDGRPVRLHRGELAAIPGRTPHSAAVPESGDAVSLNVFTRR